MSFTEGGRVRGYVVRRELQIARSAIPAMSCVGRLVRHAARRIQSDGGIKEAGRPRPTQKPSSLRSLHPSQTYIYIIPRVATHN
eukprot:3583304-Prymnesium_polylepis.1